MDRALLTLLRLRSRAAARRSFRNIKTPRGIILFLFGLVALALWLGPTVTMSIVHPSRHNPADLRDVMPLALLGMALLSVVSAGRQEGILFAPAEVDFLFSGPFTRRELLFYKIAQGMIAAIVSVLLMAVFLHQYAGSWLSMVVGGWLTLVFLQFLAIALVLFGQWIGQEAYSRGRRLLLAAIVVLLVVLAARWMPVYAKLGLRETARQLHASPLGFWLMAPLEPFSRAIAATRIVPDLLGWAALAAAVDAAMLALVVRLDVNYLEASLVASQRRYQMLQQQRTTGRIPTRAKVAWRVPRLPWLAGAGPIAWRQMTIALRTGWGMLLFLAFIFAMMLAPMLIHEGKGPAPAGIAVSQMAFLTVILTRMLSFDFRGDLDNLAWLKSLPLHPAAVAVGQLAAPVVFVTLLDLVVIGVLAAVLGVHDPILPLAAVFAVPFNLLVFGVDNVFFLLFPARAAAATPGDLQHVGRMMLEMAAKTLAVAIGAGYAALLGFIALWLSRGAWAAAMAAAWLGLAMAAGLLIPCLAWAFERFDVSTDTPA